MKFMRPARADELETLLELARLSGSGFTSLPEDEEQLAAKLKSSAASFALDGVCEPSSDHHYLMFMEDSETGEVVGSSAVKPAVGVGKPFFNFKIFSIAQYSSEAERRFDMDVMVLVNEFAGCTEVGTLFVKEGARGDGAGRLAAQSRYLLMAAAPERFGPTVVSELRGVVDEDGHSPFWEALGRKFFKMDFDDADYLSAVSDNQFILDLMPKYPIYIDLLPEAARDVIGVCHASGEGALRLLKWEGFRYDHVVDIFDGGPLVSAPRDSIRTLNESQVKTAVSGAPDTHVLGLVTNNRVGNFRSLWAKVVIKGDSAVLDPNVLSLLQIKSGEPVRVWVRR